MKKTNCKKNKLWKMLPLMAALLLTCTLLLTACGPTDIASGLLTSLAEGKNAQSGTTLPDAEKSALLGEDYQSPDTSSRRTVPFPEMEYQRPDADGLVSYIEEMTKKMVAASDGAEVIKLDKEVSGRVEDFYTMRNLVEVNKYLNVNDDYFDEEFRYCDDKSVEIQSELLEFNRAITESPYADAYKEEVGDYAYQSIENELKLHSKEVEEYKKKRNSLNADYNKKLSTLTVSYMGKEYTMEEINEIDYTTDPELFWTLYIEYYSQSSRWFAETYAEMIELDKKTAGALGFDSAAEMYYLAYSRDYTPEQTEEYSANVKKYYVPLMSTAMNASYSADASYDKTFNQMPQLLAGIDSELKVVWDNMADNELYSYKADKNKQSGVGFTTNMYSYDASFCYGYWEDDLRSVNTVIHEFGHYYENWIHMDEEVVQNLDIAEIYSQGLELLALEYISSIVGSTESATKNQMQNFLQALTYQTLLEEFQLRMYEMEDITAEKIATLYTQLLEEYGYGAYIIPDANGNDNSWFSVTHLFDAPFYTISYATSASVALQFYTLSQENYGTAADLYLAMIRTDQNQPFLELVNKAGLKSPFDETLMSELADMFKSTLAAG